MEGIKSLENWDMVPVLPSGYVAISSMFKMSPHGWDLCTHLISEHRYVTLKVYVNSSKVHRELPVYNHLDQIQSDHPGRQCIRKLLDSFTVTGPHGQHICLVHQPLGMSLWDLKMKARDKVFSKVVLRMSIRELLVALDFLHDEAHVIHTGKYIIVHPHSK